MHPIPARIKHTLLDSRVFRYSDYDHLVVRDAVAGGLAILGGTGAGKSWFIARPHALAFLRAGWGGLVLCAKREEASIWVNEYAREAGRERDVILFNAESGHFYDPIFYEFNRPGRGRADTESVIDFIDTLVSLSHPSHGNGQEPFWQLAAQQAERNAVKNLSLGQQPISILTMAAFLDSLPMHPGENQTETWQNDSYCAAVLNAIRDRQHSLTPADWGDLDVSLKFATKVWPGMDERPRSSVYMTWAGMADKFLYNPLRDIFCSGKCTFVPEQTTYQNKIIIVDFPLLEYSFQTGRLISCLMKLSFMRAWLRRNVEEAPTPVFLWQDEGHAFLLGGHGGVSRDAAFAQVSRSARVVNVFISQNILAVADALGETHPGSKTKNLLSNFTTKIFGQNTCVDTNTYAAELIGQEYRFLRNVGVGGHDVNLGRSEQRLYKLEPEAFTRLQRPDEAHPYAEAIVHQGGKTFEVTRTEEEPDGRNYLLTVFRR